MPNDRTRRVPTEKTRSPNLSTENQPEGSARRPSDTLDRVPDGAGREKDGFSAKDIAAKHADEGRV